MPEETELQLKVTLVDQATPFLRQLRQELTQMGNVGGDKLKDLVAQLEQRHRKIGEHTKGLTTEVNSAVRELGKFAGGITGLPLNEFGRTVTELTGGIGGFTTALASMPLVLREIGETLNQFSERMTGLRANADAIGLTATAFRGLADQLDVAGIKGERANQSVSNFVKTIGQATRTGTSQMQFLAGLIPLDPKLLGQARTIQDLIEHGRTGAAIQTAVADAESVRRQLLDRGRSEQNAAYWAGEVAKGLGLPADWTRLRERQFKDEYSEEEKERIHKEIEGAEAQEKAAADLAHAFRDATDELLGYLLPTFIDLEQMLSGFVKDNPFGAAAVLFGAAIATTVASLGAFRLAITALGLGGAKVTAAEIAAALKAAEAAKTGEAAKVAADVTKVAPKASWFASALRWLPFYGAAFDMASTHDVLNKAPTGESWEDVLRRKGIGTKGGIVLHEEEKEEKEEPTFKTPAQAAREQWKGKPLRLAGGGDWGTSHYGAWADMMGGPMSTNIEDRRGDADERSKLLFDNTAELKRLNDWLQGVTGGPGAAAMPRYGLTGAAGAFGAAGDGEGAPGLPAPGGAPGGGFGSIFRRMFGGGTRGIGPGVPPVPPGISQTPGLTGPLGSPGVPSQITGGPASGDLDRGAYDKMFAGTSLAGQYDNVVKAAQENGVPPSVMAAIMAHETGSGTSKMLRERNNPAGLMDPKTGMATGQSFPSIEEGIAAAGRTIGKNYRRGGGTIAGMAGIYAPVGAANDPRGLNRGWAAGVESFQRRLAAAGGATSQPTVEGDITGRGPSGGRFNVPAGSGFSGERETITLSNGERVTVNRQAAAQFKGFFNDLIAAGAPVHGLGGYGLRPGNRSQHPAGLAIDWAQTSRNVVSPQVATWIRQNPEALNALEQKWGMSGGEHWRSPDTGHFSIETLFGSRHLSELDNREALNRRALAPQTHRIEGSADINVNVSAPPGTRVEGKSAGLFKPIAMTRQVQMAHASQGPSGAGGVEFGGA